MSRAIKPANTPSRRKPAAPEFEQLFFSELNAEDAAMIPAAERQLIAENFRRWIERRQPEETLIRVYTPNLKQHGWQVGCSIVEIAMDDMPFIVDSAMGAINQLGLTVQIALHPVLNICRDRTGRFESVTTTARRLAAEGKHSNEALLHIRCDEIQDEASRQNLVAMLQRACTDLRKTVQDWQPMQKQTRQVIAEIGAMPAHIVPRETMEEVQHFLQWLHDNHFTFLGYRAVELIGKGKNTEMTITKNTGLGILRDPKVFVFNNLRALSAQPPDVQRFVREPRLIMVTKTNLRATVHRPVPMDAVFVKRFNSAGQVIGEHLFIGLFTSYSYSRSPREIPLLRQKVARALAKSGFDPVSHDGKALVHILDNYPRDELFQISDNELFRHAMGILGLQLRQHVALFTRHDPFERFVSCLIYVPRDQYDSALRSQYRQLLEAAFAGHIEGFDVRIDDHPMARLLMTVITTPGEVPTVDLKALETELRDIARPWSDRMRNQLRQHYADPAAVVLIAKYDNAFAADYRAATDVTMALEDIASIEGMGERQIGINLLPAAMDDDPNSLRFRVYHRGPPLALSQVLPMIENMGLFVLMQRGPYTILPKEGAQPIVLHDFVARMEGGLRQPLAVVKPLFEETFRQVWSQHVADDGFNQLVLRAALPWRAVNILRTLAKYAHQIRAAQSQSAMIAALSKHLRLAQVIVELFEWRHDPARQKQAADKIAVLQTEAQDLLAQVPNLDEDRIIRRFLNLVAASVRTNHYQLAPTGGFKDYLAIKFASGEIEGLPLPKPLYEIFVASARMEAVHLRGGRVARGGIRWSDRHDDFRTEVLGLMKAQMVKNSVIVPVGAKGGFVVKYPDPQNPVKEAIACYQTLIRGMLDVTDNQRDGKIIPPPNLVRHDGDDPYIVAAADKGTAKFSDIANGIAADYGFWLGDAFASGGSVGYDHKHMGITARGAWEAVKRHFHELGKDIQTTDFTCIGVGDMSGDVFGNGMLLSKHTRLLAAFDHRHIFCDPNPDSARSHKERQRLYNLPSSSWADYDASLISKGGGVFSRQLKSIKITPQIQAAYGIAADVTSLSPAELVQAILRAPVELLYFGGIGTYVKSSDERHEEVGDRANDALRVDGDSLRAKIVAEGANLALTQKGRIDYAMSGGRINTDAIDNSAGVDTSDHEVNIKIALDRAIRDRKLTLPKRNKLLTAMTEDVAELVLRSNYQQAQALSLTEMHAPELLGNHARVIRMLERAGLLNRKVENLPDEETIQERQREGRGLTRPELAILMAYAKIWLYQALVASTLPDDPFLQMDLMHYFPTSMQRDFKPYILNHPLRREIIATSVTNSLVNHAGIHFIMRMTERTGRSAAAVARAYILAREVFALFEIWSCIKRLDNKVPAKTQLTLRYTVNMMMRRSVPWFLTHLTGPLKLESTIKHYREGVKALTLWQDKHTASWLSAAEKQKQDSLRDEGVPQGLAHKVVSLMSLSTAPDLQDLSQKCKRSLGDLATIYFRLENECGFAWLREKLQTLPTPTPWQRDAGTSLFEDSYAAQKRLTAVILKNGGKSETSYQLWREDNRLRLQAIDQMLIELQSSPIVDFAMLGVAVRRLADLAGPAV
jgi:glutamate dehydrogenase